MVFPSYSCLQIDKIDAQIIRFTLNRPEVRNAFNTRMAEEVIDAQAKITLEIKQGNCRILILTGSSDKAFCAGADLKERDGLSREQWDHQHKLFETMAYQFMNFPVPVLGLINGSAFGGGMELMLACDFVIAADHARFALPEVGLGIMPGLGATQLLPRAVGASMAKKIILSGKPITAIEALEMGLVLHLSKSETLTEEGLQFAREIANNAPLAVQAALKSIRLSQEYGLKTGIEKELSLYNTLIDTKDRQEGIKAFNEKRKPNFTGH